MDNTEKYLKMTGQDFKYLMSGSRQYGDNFITEELVTLAISENKKIVWNQHLVDGEDIGLLDYELQPI
jgi:hypothetical protein